MVADYQSMQWHEHNDPEKTEDMTEETSSAKELADLEDVDVKIDEVVPDDTWNAVAWIILLNGIGVLLPWNMFITIAPQYYVDYWFTVNGTETHYGTSFMSALGIVSQIPNFLVACINVLNLIRGPVMYRIVGPLTANCLLVGVILSLVIFQQPSDSARGWFYVVSLIIVMTMNATNGLYQNSFFGLVADFPAKYTNAVVVGTNVSGTFTSLLSIISIAAFNNNPKTVALMYFSISLGVLFVCMVSLWLVSKQKFFQYYVKKGAVARLKENVQKFDIRMYWETVKHCYMQLLSVFLVYFVTLSVFPTILVGFEPTKSDGTWNSVIPNQYYTGVTTFLNFNFFAAVGSTTASFIQFPGPKLLIIPVALRLLFIPFFMLSNYLPNSRVMPVWYSNEWIFFFGNTIMAFTSGYFSSLGMMYAPRVCPPHLSKLAGQIAALCLVTGIMCGVAFTPLITTMVQNIK
ncbi:unnamed protein product [Caenorhabditis auriculariae]|uniref:Uncharacterized protein n=1 Tax=Caenorhabditis auriculariae TaxID=2777116 RepID=A0A8S1HHJ5_9PELO|nr:unnamed protein product [Caenorhabditis auriculariae]